MLLHFLQNSLKGTVVLPSQCFSTLRAEDSVNS